MSVSSLLFRRSLKSSWPRLVLIALAVAFGVTILLSFTAYYNALIHTEAPTWTTALTDQSTQPLEEKVISGTNPALYQIDLDATNLTTDQTVLSEEQQIRVYDFALTGPNSPRLADLPLPAPGEYYVSPALDAIMRAHPEADLGSRYGDTQLGVLPEDLVEYRDQLLVIRGVSLAALGLPESALAALSASQSASASQSTSTNQSTADQLAALSDLNPSQIIYSLTPTAYDTAERVTLSVVEGIIYLGIFILLLPVLFLISISTRLGSVQREQRYAALRLVGFTNGQVVRSIAFESLVSTLLGIALGYLGYLAVYPILLDFSITGYRFWPSDITVLPWQHFAIIAGTILLAFLSNWWGMRHVHTSPLGISRRQKMERPPRAWRLLPLLAGCACTLIVQFAPNSTLDIANKTTLIIFAVVLIMVGLVFATPWLTYRLANLVARHTRRPVSLLATRYIRQHARAIARSVSGVVLALFAGSFYLVAVSGVPALEAASIQANPDSLLADDTALIKFVDPRYTNQLTAALQAAEYIESFLPVEFIDGALVGSCTALADYFPSLQCDQAEHQYAAIGSLIQNPDAPADSNQRFITYAATEDELLATIHSVYSETGATDTAGTPVTRFLVHIRHDQIDALRSLVARTTRAAADDLSSAYVLAAATAHAPAINQVITELAGLAYFGIIVTMVVATISIVISTLGSLYERRHTLYTLHLSGLQLAELKQEIMIESLIPLLLTAFVSVALGIWVAVVEIATASSTLMPTITPTFVLLILGLLAAATIAIYLTLKPLPQLVDPSHNQTE